MIRSGNVGIANLPSPPSTRAIRKDTPTIKIYAKAKISSVLWLSGLFLFFADL